MTLEQTLDETLKRAMKDKDGRTTDVVRMLKTKLQERRTAKGFAGVVDDALVLDVIGAYRKQLQKAIAEYDKIGERGAAQAATLRFGHANDRADVAGVLHVDRDRHKRFGAGVQPIGARLWALGQRGNAARGSHGRHRPAPE